MMDKKTKMLFICICAVAFVAVGAAAAMFIMMNNNKEEDDVPPTAYTMEEENYQQIMEDMSAQVEEGYFETYMTTDWVFPDGSSEASQAMLGNSPNNTKPIRCELLLNETGEVLFSTNVLPVGALVSPIKLDKNLEAGVYDATCMIYLMDEKEDGTFEDYSSAGFRVTLTIQN